MNGTSQSDPKIRFFQRDTKSRFVGLATDNLREWIPQGEEPCSRVYIVYSIDVHFDDVPNVSWCCHSKLVILSLYMALSSLAILSQI